MRRPTVPNKAPTVISASVALARLSVYANGESVLDHKNPNIPIFIFLSSTTAAEGREDARLLEGEKVSSVDLKSILFMGLVLSFLSKPAAAECIPQKSHSSVSQT